MSRINSALNLPPLPCPSRIVSLAGSGVGQLSCTLISAGISTGVFVDTLALLFRDRMAPIVIVGRARAFGRHHGRSQWIFRRTAHAKRGTIRRLLQSLQDLRADALGGLVDDNLAQVKDS